MLVENKNMPNGRNKYTNSEKCNWCPACVLQVEPHMGSMTLSPFSGEEKIRNYFPVLVLWDNCWCHHCTASFPLQNTDILSMSVHRDALRNPGEVVLKTISLLQAVVGSLDDVILFFHSNSPILFGRKKRRTDMILTHLALANLLIILFSGIPHIMAVFVLRNPLNSCGCKFVYYIQRVACGTALCSTCVLSTCQSFTLTPRRAEWVMLRGRAPRVAGPSHCICWMLSLLMNICVPLITGPENARNDTGNQGKWFCSPIAPYTVAPWCFSCTDTTSGCSIFTPPLGTADAPRRPEPPTPSWCWYSPLSSSMC